MTHTSTHVGTEHSLLEAPARIAPTLPAEAPRLFAPRRRQARFAVRRLEVLSPVFGSVVEASAAGLQLESAAPLLAGASYVFRFARGGRFLNQRGRVAWSRLDRFETSVRGSRPVFQAGIELEGGSGESAWRSALAHGAGVTVDT